LADQPEAPANGAEAKPEPKPLAVVPSTLRACIQLTLERQPTLAAARASLASAETAYAALCNTGRIARVLAPDLPSRIEQASRGVDAKRAELAQLEWDVTYAVTRNYISTLYARQQAELIDNTLDEITEFFDRIKNVGATDLVKARFDVSISLGRTRRTEAEAGYRRAVAALREACGLSCDDALPLPPQNARLPLPQGDPLAGLSCSQIVALAVERRGEIQQSYLFLDATELEIGAQASLCFRFLTRTLAAGGDIHARSIPVDDFGEVYRPGALAPEMPVNMAGRKGERVARAAALRDRAAAAADKTKNLVTLEAESAWHQISRAAEDLRILQAAVGQPVADLERLAPERTREPALEPETNEQRYKQYIDDLLLAARAKAALSDAHYQLLLGMAALQRITAGGYVPPVPDHLPLSVSAAKEGAAPLDSGAGQE
jgi:outer membrane protein TolC